ncbi:TPA: linear amide C-N hydrolase [Vibrio campbellii]|uniref:linear amide C-N hydrolase n=1 Tax=Vibrio campbellii TaxID=680 RepID=UPI00097FA6E6|nr:linear amide C-N hydrolase [Vibrio campbellii]AQM67084.1 Choloylglycine hydrolase [Vibrio campbellii]HDM8232787.1 linear amide C-N hydrolase [Vibrio campbellii]
MKLIKKSTLLSTCIAGLIGTFSIAEAEACSRITWSTDKGVFLSRTFDWLEGSHAAIENFPKGTSYTRSLRSDAALETSKFAVAAVTSYGGLVGEAVNEVGLAGNVLFLDEMDIDDVSGSTSFGHAKIMQHLVSQYASVKEAVSALANMEMLTDDIPGMPTTMTVHYALQDKSGDSAIIEWVDKELKIWHGAEYQVLTNSPEFQIHLANLEQASKEWGPKVKQDSTINIGSNSNIHSSDRFLHNNYFLQHLTEPTSITNGIMKLESIIYSVPHDAPNRVVNGEMTGYGTEWVLTQNLNTGDSVLRYTWDDTNNFIVYNVKELLASGERIKFDVTQPGIYGDITNRILSDGKL